MSAAIRRLPLSDHHADTILANPDLGWSEGALDEARANRERRLRRVAYPRDWFDAHCDYAATGDASYRAERIAHEREDVPAQREGTGVLTYLAGSVLILAAMLLGIPLYCLLLVWIGGIAL